MRGGKSLSYSMPLRGLRRLCLVLSVFIPPTCRLSLNLSRGPGPRLDLQAAKTDCSWGALLRKEGCQGVYIHRPQPRGARNRA